MPHYLHPLVEKQYVNNYQYRYKLACGKCSFCTKPSCYKTPVSLDTALVYLVLTLVTSQKFNW